MPGQRMIQEGGRAISGDLYKKSGALTCFNIRGGVIFHVRT